AAEIRRYQSRLSGPLADRIDMHVTLAAVPVHLLHAESSGESSAAVRARVETCRSRQRRRYERLLKVRCNAHVAGRWLLSHGGIDADARGVLDAAVGALQLSARGYHRVLRVACPIAD